MAMSYSDKIGWNHVYTSHRFSYGIFCLFNDNKEGTKHFMKIRKTFSIIFYALNIVSCVAAGYATWLAMSKAVSVKFGFLTFIILWILSYWFSTFSTQLLSIKKSDGKMTYLISEKTFRSLGRITSLLNMILLLSWIIIYVKLYVIK